jgi:2-oxoisovalerate dehydrogenase E1 component
VIGKAYKITWILAIKLRASKPHLARESPEFLGHTFQTMFNRAEIIDQNFSKFVLEGHLPAARSQTQLSEAGLTGADLMDLFETQLMSRHLDLRARILKNENKCYYTIGSSGHEGNAANGKAFRLTDMAFLHYRSGGFMIQRAKLLPGSTPLYDNMLTFFAALEEPIAGGRHKVFGSKPLLVPPQTSTIASHLPKAVGAAFSITKAKHAGLEQTVMPSDSLVVCTFGDASANHATAQSAFNTAAWLAHQKFPLPLIFICEDNGIGISVATPNNWIETTYSNRVGLHYIQCDGLNLADTFRAAKEAEHVARTQKKPVFLHMKTIRLMGHAGSDLEVTYNSVDSIAATEFNDPLLHTSRMILENGLASQEDIVKLYKDMEARVKSVSDYCEKRPQLEKAEDVRCTITANTEKRISPEAPTENQMQELFGANEYAKLKQPLHLAKLINTCLHELMVQYPQICIFGEDVAAKGGVYNVTEGLFKKFGQKRIFNTLLDETTILGTAIGMAHNGFLPIPEIQFLAYVHNAEDQIRGEASTLAFFSKGQFTNPMIIRVAGLAYQKGFGGHFHNDNSLAIFRDIPGLIVAVPSNGEDAVKMLRTCAKEAYENGRVVIFVEPIALYMTRDLHETNDKAWTFAYPPTNEKIELGEFGVYGDGKDLTIVTYGNGNYYSRQAVKVLEEKHKIKSRIIDLRWISPVNWEKLTDTIGDAKNILFVEECRKTGSFSEQIVSGLIERLSPVPNIRVVAADDCFIPLGRASAAGLPKKEEVITAALRLLNRL